MINNPTAPETKAQLEARTKEAMSSGIPCCNSPCPFFNTSFEQNCLKSDGLEECGITDCISYIPTRFR